MYFYCFFLHFGPTASTTLTNLKISMEEHLVGDQGLKDSKFSLKGLKIKK